MFVDVPEREDESTDLSYVPEGDGETLSEGSIEAPQAPVSDDAISFVEAHENEAEILRTGSWHTLGSGLEAGVVLGPEAPPKGVRLRRLGADVQIEALVEGVEITVDGSPSKGGTISLRDHVVKVDGVRIDDEMVPRDTLELDELPDYFAPVVMGRDPESDFVLESPATSARHASLSRREGYLLLEDLDSSNGTFVENRRIKRARIGWRQPFKVASTILTPVEVVQRVREQRAGSSTSVIQALQADQFGAAGATGVGVAILGPGVGASAAKDPSDKMTSSSFRLTADRTLVVGRDATADIVIDTPNVSRFHAQLSSSDGGIVVEDLGSTNGTWVNGSRVEGPTPVGPDDDLRFGPHRLQFNADLSVEGGLEQGGVNGVRLDAHKIVRKVGPKNKPITVVDRVSFSILPGEMVAVMGPSGAGKTSVLTTLAGYTPPSAGGVYLDGLSLYRHYDVFRNAVGYVPQEDVMHRTLTAAEVLYYQAKLEFPPEVTDDEIDARITTVLQQLDLDRVRDSIVGDENRRGMSGGQRKRLNVAMEMLSEPSLLILDEPTSGLDARSAMELIRQCRSLASGGRTVVMTVHQPRQEAFDLFDKVLLLTTGGKVAFFGPPEQVRAYFSARTEVPDSVAANPADYALDVLDPVEQRYAKPPKYWKKSFRQSDAHAKFVADRLSDDADDTVRKKGRPGAGARLKARPLRQLLHLTRRYALVKWRDRNALMVQLVQAPIIALLALLLFYEGRFMPLFLEDDVTPTLFVLMAAAVWFGCSNVAREIVAERAIFQRERMGSLRPGPYLLSKMLLQGFFIAIQVAILLAILVPGVPLEGGVVPLAAVTLLTGLSAMALGLLLSTLARTELQAIQFVPLAILPQIMLSGILVPVAGKTATLMASVLSKPVLLRWAYSAALWVEFAPTTTRGQKAAGVGGAKYWERSGFLDDFLRMDVFVIAGLGLACSLVSWWVLSRRDRP